MISGTHIILYSSDAEKDKAFFRDVLKFPYVDAGHGWLIFGMSGGEAAFHPGEANDKHELYLMCDDLPAVMDQLEQAGVSCEPAMQQRWGLLTHLTLPGGGRLGLYQPRHARP